MIDYTDKTALVTGGGSGIGRALAQALAARGARVIIADLDGAGAAQTVTMIGGEVRAITCDLADADAPARLIADCLAISPRLDLVCSNAGIGRNKRLLKEALDATATRLFNVNFFAGLRLAQAYAAALTETAQHGRMLLTGSENSLSVPSAVRGAGLGLYAASKHALLIMAEWLRDELAASGAPLGLHVLLPGAVYTPLVSKNLPDPAKAPAELGLIMPERCADLALRGLDLGLFYIPTHAHLAADMRPRSEGIAASLRALGLD